MTTRFITKTLSIAALGIALSLLLAAPTTASPAWNNTAGALQLDPPAAPSDCRVRTTRFRDGHNWWHFSYATWTDNSSNEDGFTVEEWWRNQSGVWVLVWSVNRAANSTSAGADGSGPDYQFRVKAFNASGESAWSNWSR
jgi:hypothetical protein